MLKVESWFDQDVEWWSSWFYGRMATGYQAANALLQR
jgi:hypothetical protein